jgi:hypothetical protein
MTTTAEVAVHCHSTLLGSLDRQPQLVFDLLDHVNGLAHRWLGHTHLTHPAGHAIINTHNLQYIRMTAEGAHILS